MIQEAVIAGRTLDLAVVDALIADAAILVAHKASFDCQFVSVLLPLAATKPWACTIENAEWRDEGFSSAALDVLAMRFGFFYEGRHRAVDDCLATIEILRQTTPRSGLSVWAKVLESARRGRVRLRATRAPFEIKDRLKSRGHHWGAARAAAAKCWYIDLASEDAVDAEVRFLEEIAPKAPIAPQIERLSAVNRFSDRK